MISHRALSELLHLFGPFLDLMEYANQSKSSLYVQEWSCFWQQAWKQGENYKWASEVLTNEIISTLVNSFTFIIFTLFQDTESIFWIREPHRKRVTNCITSMTRPIRMKVTWSVFSNLFLWSFDTMPNQKRSRFTWCNLSVGIPHNKRNREQRIRISTYQKLCIVEYIISDKLKFLFSVLCSFYCAESLRFKQ